MSVTTTARPYRSSKLLGTLAAIAILVAAGLNALVSLGDGYGRATYATWADPDADLSGTSEAILLMAVGLGGLALPVAVLTAGVLFCVWLHRVAWNARALGVQWLEFTPGWAVGYFFIPILNLWKPYQAVREIWQSSDPEAQPDFWSTRPATLVGAWWAFWILGNAGGGVLDRIAATAGDGPTILLSSVIGAALVLTSGVLAALVILAIVRRQGDKARLGPVAA